MHCVQNAKKRLLLTATPIVNNIGDLFALINFIYGRNVVGSRDDVKAKHAEISVGKTLTQENLDNIYKLLKGRIDYFTDISASKFPLTKQHYVEVQMPREYKKQYERYIVKHEDDMEYFFEHPEAFYNAQRRVVNKVADDYFSKKIEAILSKIKQGKTLIYTNWLDFGVTPIKETLDHADISYGIFTGKLSKEKRNKLVEQFNDDEIDALILTSAGAEGLDLKGTKNVIILDPPWHPAGLNQIIGRAVRYKSHTHLPKNERNVHIYKMVMVEKAGMKWNNATTKSGDALLYQIIEKKSHLTREIHNLLQRISRSQAPSRKYQAESSPEFLVYGRETCPFTRDANSCLAYNKRNYKFYDMEVNPEYRKQLDHHIEKTNLSDKQKQKLGFENGYYGYVPAIVYKNKFIGGFGELKNIISCPDQED
jgi:SNF2 family DNA or RNA helicase/glutaredoxin